MAKKTNKSVDTNNTSKQENTVTKKTNNPEEMTMADVKAMIAQQQKLINILMEEKMEAAKKEAQEKAAADLMKTELEAKLEAEKVNVEKAKKGKIQDLIKWSGQLDLNLSRLASIGKTMKEKNGGKDTEGTKLTRAAYTAVNNLLKYMQNGLDKNCERKFEIMAVLEGNDAGYFLVADLQDVDGVMHRMRYNGCLDPATATDEEKKKLVETVRKSTYFYEQCLNSKGKVNGDWTELKS